MLSETHKLCDDQLPRLSPNPFADAILSFIDEIKENENRKSLFYKEVVQVACHLYLADEQIDQSLISATQLSKYIAELELQHRKKSGVRRAFATAQPLVEGLVQYTAAVDVMIQADPTVSALIYGGAKLVLQLANGYTKYFEQITQMMADIGIQLQYFHIYTREFATDKHMSGVLYNSYKDILLFWRDSSKILNQRGKRFLAGGLLVPFNERYAKFKQKLDRNAESVRNMAQALHVQSQGAFNRIHELQMRTLAATLEQSETDRVNGYQNTESAIQIEEVRKWIAGGRASRIDPRPDLERHLSSRHIGTCQWIFGDPKFANWETSGETSSLWVNAAPGSGKSVLCASVIESLTQSDIKDRNKVIYFFCRFDEPEKCTAMSALRSIALQALKLINDIPNELYHLYQEECSAKDCYVANIAVAERVLGLLLKHIAYVSVIVDGLDECHESTLLDSFFRLQAQIGHGITKWLFSSRDDPIVRKKFGNFTSETLMVPKSVIQNDIRKFLEDNADLLCGTCDQLNTFTKLSQGNFLMIRLTVDPFRNEELTCFEEFEEAIENFQPELGRCWFRSLQRLLQRSPQIQELAQMIFTAVILAAQPMTFNELVDLLAIKIDEEPSSRRQRTRSVIQSACSPFVEVDYDSDFVNPTLRLVHKSISDFLIQDPTEIDFVAKDCYKFFVNFNEGNADLGRRCLTYLSYKRYADYASLELNGGTNSSEHGFLKYAAIFWHKHFHQSRGSQELSARVHNFLKLPNLWTCIRIQSKYAPHMLAKLSYNSKTDSYNIHLPGSKKPQGDQDFYADVLPQWLGEYDSEGENLVWSYHMFVREWAEVLVRYPDKIQEYFAQVLGPRGFWSTKGSPNFVTVTTAEGPTAFQDLLQSYKVEQPTTSAWMSQSGRKGDITEYEEERSQYIKGVLSKNRGEWKFCQSTSTTQTRVTAVVYRYQSRTPIVGEEDSFDEEDSDSDCHSHSDVDTAASPRTHQSVLWFLSVTDSEGVSHWFHHSTKSGISQKSAPVFIPHSPWLFWPQDESLILLLNIETWASSISALPELEKGDVLLISQDHHYSASTNHLHRASIYGSNTDQFFTIRHTIFQVSFSKSSSHPPHITLAAQNHQETTWRGASTTPNLPVSFNWLECTLYAALGSSAVKILCFTPPEPDSISPIRILKTRLYIPSSSYARNVRFLLSSAPAKESLRAIFLLSEAPDSHLPATKLDFAMNSNDWEDYDPGKHDDEVIVNSGDFLKGAYAAKEQAFSMPIRSGLDWRRSVYVTCW